MAQSITLSLPATIYVVTKVIVYPDGDTEVTCLGAFINEQSARDCVLKHSLQRIAYASYEVGEVEISE